MLALLLVALLGTQMQQAAAGKLERAHCMEGVEGKGTSLTSAARQTGKGNPRPLLPALAASVDMVRTTSTTSQRERRLI